MGMNQEVAYRAGVRDWLIQRASALVMVAYIIVMIAWLTMQQQFTFSVWSNLFSCTWMKVFTVIFIASLCLHAWVGIWTIFTDYVKPFVLRMALNFLVLLALLAYFIWTIQILWGV